MDDYVQPMISCGSFNGNHQVEKGRFWRNRKNWKSQVQRFFFRFWPNLPFSAGGLSLNDVHEINGYRWASMLLNTLKN